MEKRSSTHKRVNMDNMTTVTWAQDTDITGQKVNLLIGTENPGRENKAVRKAGEHAQGNAFAEVNFTKFKKDKGLWETGFRNKRRKNTQEQTGEKKQTRFTVPVPGHVVPDDHEFSPMDVNSPMLRIRSIMTRKPQGVLDIDAIKDPLTCSEYAQDVIDYLQTVERRTSFPDKYLMQNGNHVKPQMRAVLMDWLIEVQVEQDLSQYTLHLCVNLIDKFLSNQNVLLKFLQLVGITALLISAKYHERFPPKISDLCCLANGIYDSDDVLKMERYMLQKVNFDLSIPGPVVFLERFLLLNKCEKKLLIQSMSMFLLDLTLTELVFVHFYPSLLAASAIYLSRELLGCDVLWDQSFAHYTKYSENDLGDCVRALKRLLSKLQKSKFTGAKQKYAHHRFHSIIEHRVLIPTELWPKKEDRQNERQETLIM